jgi:hypothetical protein
VTHTRPHGLAGYVAQLSHAKPSGATHTRPPRLAGYVTQLSHAKPFGMTALAPPGSLELLARQVTLIGRAAGSSATPRAAPVTQDKVV